MELYVGTYDMGQGFMIKVFQKDNTLFADATGQGTFELKPISDAKFLALGINANLSFLSENGDRITGLHVVHSEMDVKGKKLD